jgi:hypothetical protein
MKTMTTEQQGLLEKLSSHDQIKDIKESIEWQRKQFGAHYAQYEIAIIHDKDGHIPTFQDRLDCETNLDSRYFIHVAPTEETGLPFCLGTYLGRVNLDVKTTLFSSKYSLAQNDFSDYAYSSRNKDEARAFAKNHAETIAKYFGEIFGLPVRYKFEND